MPRPLFGALSIEDVSSYVKVDTYVRARDRYCSRLLRKWITVASTRRGSVASAAPIMLAVMTQSPSAASPSDGHLEMILPGGTVRIRACVSRDALQVVIDCLSRRP